MDFVAPATKFGDDILGEKASVTAGYIDIHISHAKQPVQNRFKIL